MDFNEITNATLQLRVQEALDVIGEFGQTDGDHHKTWVIDQVVRALVGEGAYDAWVYEYEHGECSHAPGDVDEDGACDDENMYAWDEGIAP